KSIGSHISFASSLKIVLGSIFLNLAIPTASIGGELFRIYSANRGYGYSYEAASVTVLLHRIFSLLPFLSGSTIGFLYLSICFAIPSILSQTLSVAAVAIAIFSLLALVIIVYPRTISVMIKPILKLTGGRREMLYSRIETFISRFEYSMKNLTSMKKVAGLSIILSWMAWILDVMVAYFVFLSLRYSVEIPIIISIYTIGITIQMIPVGIPGMVGVVETVMATLYSLAGIPSAISVAATLMIRIVMLWFEVAIGSIALVSSRI
ncbi:MAG: flippase-like domain-containing protein, partial [Candidatus Bathyarchaeia archaeon]